MKAELQKLFAEGDYILNEAKSKFYLYKEEQADASCGCCNAVKKYLDAYEKFLFEGLNPSENYHVLLHTISQRDNGFRIFTERIYQVKCFADESKKEGVKFFLYPDEIDDALKTAKEIRDYIAEKIGLEMDYYTVKSDSSFMAL